MTRDEHTDHDPTDKVERYHTDPTRAARIAEAIRLTRPLVPGILSLIERVLGNDPTAEEPSKAAVSAAYEKACEVVASVDLEIRRGVLEYTVVNTPGLRDGLKIEVEFTLAAPLDGTDAVMPDRHCYFGYGAEASDEFLLDSARRYWLCTYSFTGWYEPKMSLETSDFRVAPRLFDRRQVRDGCVHRTGDGRSANVRNKAPAGHFRAHRAAGHEGQGVGTWRG